MPPTYRLVVPAVFNSNSFEYFLNQLPARTDFSQSNIIFDLGLVSSISPDIIGSLLVLHDYSIRLGAQVKMNFYDNHFLCMRFMQWGVFDHISCSCDQTQEELEKPEETSCDVFFKLHPIHSEDDIYKAIEFLRENLQLPQEEFTDLIVVLSEISQNILEHSTTQGYLHIAREYQRLRRKNLLHLCVVDSGVGMGQSLKERLRQYEFEHLDSFAIYKALYEGISRYDDPGRGNGIIKTRGIVKKYHGKMVIRSGCAKLWGDVPSWQIERFLRKDICYLPGTQVHITFPISAAPIKSSHALIKKS